MFWIIVDNDKHQTMCVIILYRFNVCSHNIQHPHRFPFWMYFIIYLNAERFSKCKYNIIYVWHKVRVRLQTIRLGYSDERRDVVKVGYDKQYLNLLARDPRTCCGDRRRPRTQNRKRMSGLGPSKAHHKTHMNSGPAQAQPHQTRWQRPHLDQSPHLQVHLLPIQ